MRNVRTLLLAAFLLIFSLAAPAQDGDKPFAEAHVVLQLADGDDKSQARTLSVANNLIKHYGGPDFIDIEIVAYGPGISLLYPDNANRERIESLMANDVRFVGCGNTLDTIERSTGERPELIADVVLVKTGVARLIERAQQDFVVIRP
jgi:intracellular sulfur oxidation DsrE/DsrF family protein